MTPSADRESYRSTVMDRVFADARSIALLGPVEDLSEDTVRRVLTAAENSSPTPRIALEPRGDRRRWRYRTGIADGAVTHLDAMTGADAGTMLTAIRNRPGPHLPVEVLLCGDYIAVDYSHGVGDGLLGTTLIGALAGDPDGSRAPTFASTLPRSATLSAVRRHFGANPAALKDFRRLRGELKSYTPPPAATRRVENWTSARVCRTGYIPADHVSTLRSWAKADAPGATGGSVNVALVAAALRAEGLEVDDRVSMLFNSRRYLEPEFAGTHGNFAVAIPVLLPHEPSPADIAGRMRAVIESGWPVAILAMSGVQNTLGRLRSRAKPESPDTPEVPPSAMPSSVEVPDRVRLVVSDLGRLPMYDHLPWIDDERPRQMAASVEPDGPDGISVLVSDVQGGRTFTASFCSAMIDPDVVESALARMCTDPVALVRSL